MVAISEAMATALQAYQVGNVVMAEWTCRQVLEQRPHYIPALHLLGAIAHQTGRLESAIDHYQTVIKLDPHHAEAHGNLAVALQDQGDWDAAASHFAQALTLNPHHAPTQFNAGNLALKQQQFEQAIAHYQQAIVLKPDYSRAYNNLGHAFREQGNLELAIAQYRQAIALTPKDAQAHNNLGNALQAQGQVAAAIDHYQTALALQPANAEVQFNLGNLYRALEQSGQAIDHYQQALTLKPAWAAAHNNLALCLQEQRQFAAAISQFQQALALEPENADVHNNLGVVFYEQNQLEGAIDQCQRAIDLKPHFAEAHLNLSMALLAAGDYQRGWREYEWRWEAQALQRPSLQGSVWDGSALAGRTLLLYTEQGFGDVIQFIRYVDLLAAQGRLIVQCPSELIRLFATLPAIAQLVAHGDPLPAFDVYLPLLSLPYVLNDSLATIPNQVPYLAVPEAARSPFDDTPLNAANPDRPFKIGIVWASVANNPRQRQSYRHRTAPLIVFIQGLWHPHVELYSLQVGVHAADIAEYGLQEHLHDLSPQLQDFADTAAAIDRLDLIITVDTAVAHLAGALAKPVWVVLPFASDWRWLLNREDSPWYPTMRLFRQETPGDWEGIMAIVAKALSEKMGVAGSGSEALH